MLITDPIFITCFIATHVLIIILNIRLHDKYVNDEIKFRKQEIKERLSK